MRADPRRVRLLVGGYGADRGRARGLSLLEHDYDAGTLTNHGLVAAATSVSFLVANRARTMVYGVCELEQGQVVAYRWTSDGSALEQVSQQPTEGADPCHLVLHPSGRWLFTANYTSGDVTAHPVRADGTLAPLSGQVRLQGSGPHPERQLSTHPHMLCPFDGGAQLAVADLGADRVWVLAVDPVGGSLRLRPDSLTTPAGSGPRQVLLDEAEERAYVLCELDGSLVSASWPPRGHNSVQTTRAVRQEPEAVNYPAALIWLRPDRRLLASHRGADVLTTITTSGPTATALHDSPSGGRGPRHLSLHEDTLYVAHELSDQVTAGTWREGHDGFRVETSIAVPSPSCVLVVDPP